MTLPDLVTTTEDLLDGEHKAWLPQMLGMQHQPQVQRAQENRTSKLGDDHA
jgi:hypothetical protein